jgi:hypothetical protein
MSIKTQNMTVLTVEFTSIPLSRRGGAASHSSFTARITLRRSNVPSSHRKYTSA